MTSTVLALVPDAFGGRGGIALYNRYFLRALCSHPGVCAVDVVPRGMSYDLEEMPDKLHFHMQAVGGKLRFLKALAEVSRHRRDVALVVCGHLNLLPFAEAVALRFRCPVLPLIYGRDAWEPTRHALTNLLVRRLGAFVSIRHLTANRFRQWAALDNARCYYLPNCIDLTAYGVAARRPDLIARYGLADRRVVMTTGRIESSRWEPNKGFDEVLEVMPGLAQSVPNISYLVMGDGEGLPELKEKAKALGVAERVIFTGYVHENEKADHYRLADVVAMPGSNPTFDRYPFRFAFLEPLACGVPVVGARLEDTSERDDPDARALVIQVDPNDPVDIRRGIIAGLGRPHGEINPVLRKFDYGAFEARVRDIVADFIGQEGRPNRAGATAIRRVPGLG